VSDLLRRVFLESPFVQEWLAEVERAAHVKVLLVILEGRFGSMPGGLRAGIEQVMEEEQLLRLALEAATCVSLEAFANRLQQELSAPPPASPRGKRGSRKLQA
jgi:hypothetical protein